MRLRPPSEWGIIGKPMQRIDIVSKSTGTQVFGIDVNVPDMVHATVRLNPHLTGKMNRFDASKALKQRGVQAVVPVTGGVGIVASNTWYAIQAAQHIEFDWEPAAFPSEQEDHWAALSGAFTDEFRDSRKRDDGDIEAGLTIGQLPPDGVRLPSWMACSR